jgi:hypothetical protein
VTALLANGFIIGVFAVAGALNALDPDLYYRVVQEDEFIEWASFWAFLVAGITYLLLARQNLATAKSPWFAIAFGLLCILIAMEEISWGQRVIGYRPPQYFLANNFQQELNVHNVMATSYRKAILHAIIVGFGVALPVLRLIPATKPMLTRLNVTSAPPVLIPAFFVTSVFYAWYPWTHSGEWVELMLGLGFLFSGIWGLASVNDASLGLRLPKGLVGGVLMTVVLAFGATVASRQQRSGHEDNLTAAHIELTALKNDFLAGKMRVRCDVHKRLYTYINKYGQAHLVNGEFAGLTQSGLPEDRASYLLDPWNTPYWIRDVCAEDQQKRIAFIYSFGPNRRRESTRLNILGDDVGLFILEPGGSASSQKNPRSTAGF